MTKVTVLMPVYNAETYLREAIDSILSQTLTDFEFLIIDDCSTDKSAEIIHSYIDARIRLICNQQNLGVAATLNKGIAQAQGQYIARMDADDISLSVRLAKQVDFMDSQPSIGICGSWLEIFGINKRSYTWRPPAEHDELKCFLFFHSCFGHPSVIMRKSVLLANNLHYNESFRYAQDYELWCKLLDCTKGANLQEALVKYRRSGNQVTINQQGVQQSVNEVRFSLLNKLGIILNENQRELHPVVVDGQWVQSTKFFQLAIEWLESVIQSNDQVKYFPSPLFAQILSKFVFTVCLSYAKTDFRTYKFYKNSNLFKYHSVLADVPILPSFSKWGNGYHFASMLNPRLQMVKLGVKPFIKWW